MKTSKKHLKRAMRTALLVLLVCVVGIAKMYASYDFSAVCETGQTLYYNITDATNHHVELTCPGTIGANSWTGFTKPTGGVILPGNVQHNGVTYSVTSIGNYAFYGCTGLTSMVIPNLLNSIGSDAFYYCIGLTSITIPNSVTSIEGDAFNTCIGLTSITIPNSVTYMGRNPFAGCSGLEQIVVDIENTVYNSHEDCNAIIKTSNNELVTGCKNTIIPNSVTSIGVWAFFYCQDLTSIVIPNSVNSIGTYAFVDCQSLTSIIIPNSVTYMGTNPFSGCISLEQIIVDIGNTVYDSREGSNAIIKTSNNELVTGCKNTIIPNSVTSIGVHAFRFCNDLTSIIIPNSVNSIGDFAFDNCDGLTSLTVLADNPPVLGNDVFDNVPKDIPVYVPIGTIGAYQNADGWNEFTNYQEIETPVPPTDYISDGLIMYLDGIYNTRNGHSTTTDVWEDLMGNYDLTVSNYSSYTWEDNHFIGLGNGGYLNTGYTWQYFNSLNDDLTIEIVTYIDCDKTSPGYRGLVGWHMGSYNGTVIQNDQGSMRMQTLGFMPVTDADDQIATISYTRYNGSFLNGSWSVDDGTIWRGINSNYTVVFGNSYLQHRGWNDSIYCIRMYNRTLTPEEVAYNHSIDVERFGAGNGGGSPLGEFTYMSPTNNYPFTSFPIEFSWDAVSGAQHYDLYLWSTNDTMPEEPYVSGLTNGYYHCTSLPNHQTYQWYVKAYNPCNAINSDIRTFSLDVEPALNVNMQNINFGEVALNQSTSCSLQVSGVVLEDSLYIEITGEDAAMFSFTESTNWDSLSGGNLIVSFTPTVAQYAYNANLVISSGTLSQTVALSGSLADYFVFHTYVDEEVYPMNNIIPIHGDLMDVNGDPVSDAEVEINVFVMGMKRTLQATTNESGEFAVDFNPMPSESGYYTVNSGYVGSRNTDIHDEFNIPGMTAVTNDYILCPVTQNQPKTDSIRIRNKCNLELNDIQVSVLSAPEGCSFSFSPLSLGGLEEDYLVYTVTGSTLTQGNYYEEVRLKATSSEGAETVITIWYYCMEPRGVLDVAPKTLATTMTKGKSKIVDVMLTNNGTSATGNIFIDLPDVEWMSVVGNDTLPSLAVNDTAYFSLRFSPNEDIQLGQYSGAIAINCEHGEFVTLPYQITAVSDSTGTLVIDVTDEYTWNTNGGFGPHLANAEVTLTGYFSLETAAHGYTDENGIFHIEQLPEGYYRLHVNADKHSEYDNVILIEAGTTNQRDVFIQYQGVTYSWNVVPTEIQDQYTFELISTFETNVPAPVVTIEAPHNLPAFDESYTFNYVITNHGLINANDVVLHTPEDDDFLFTALYDHIDTLAAQTTIVIPCVVTHKDTILKSWRGECADWGYTWVEYTYECKKDGTFGHGYGYAYTLLGTYPCENTPPSIGGGAPFLGIVGGGGSGFPNPFFTSPLLEMWYDCYNGCTHLVLVVADQLVQMLPLFGQVYAILKSVVNLSEGEFLQSSFTGGSATAKLLGHSKISGILSAASAIPDLLKDIPECYKYLHDSYGWKDFQIEYLEYVPDEIREMIVYALEYSEKMGKLYNYFEMYYGDVTWLESDLDELDNFMELVFEYDSIYGHVNVDPLLLARKPSNISESQVHVFIERYNNSRDLLKGMPVSGDNYMPIDSLYTIMATILGVEYEAISLGYESGADRLTYLINNAIDYLKDNQSASVCAKVTVQFSQKMAMIREAFEGTFTVHNGHDTNAMEGVGLNFTVKDEDGNDCTNLFQINTTLLTNLSGIDGSGSLGAGMDGMAKILFIPTKEAAPIEPKVYYFGGTFSFIDPFYLDTVTMDLYPVDLTVHPSPDLYVDYFMQRDILGDDALTLDKVEPSIPAELGVIINNKGAGVAKNVILETAEPKIIDNDKGLAIDFAMYGASFNGNEAQLGLMSIPFGNIESGHTAVGEWLFTSSLLGHFVSYEAHVIHNNSYGNPNLSLVSHLDIHELIHPIRAYSDLDDGINDFLVNDVDDYYDYPDSIYFSHGGSTGVGLVDDIHFDHYVTPIDTIVTLTIHPSRIGWNYGLTDDPGTDKYELVSCTRDFDNQVIPLNNIWQTFVTLYDGSDPIYENKLHIVDTLSNDNQDITYTLVYERKRSLLEVEDILGIPQSFIEYPLENFIVKFNKPIVDSTFTYEDMVLKCNNGSNLMDSSVVISKIDDGLYNVNITGLTFETGYCVLNIHTLNINDEQGYNGYDGKQATWIQVLNGDKFVYINDDQTICENESFQPLTSIVIGNAISYQWNREGLSIEGANETEYQAVEAGIYTLTVTFEDGETATSNEITLMTYPSYHINIEDEICEGEDYTTSGFNLTHLSFGIYDEALYFQNVYGCDSIVSLHLVVHENPEVQIQIDTLTDNGINFRLTATGATNYKWSTGEITVSIIVSPTEATTYSVIGTNNHGCTDSAEVIVSGGTGIYENSQMSLVEVYPNPAHEKLFIKTSEAVKTIEIFTMTGTMVQQQSCWSDNMEINVQNLSPGMYVLRLVTDYAVETRRFVKE